ncbi:MAG: hypothetical protein FWC61_00340 [Proteobacteria bacterium]|nr:hypothetical protein [Pseudomonadota bacterium]
MPLKQKNSKRNKIIIALIILVAIAAMAVSFSTRQYAAETVLFPAAAK